MPQAYLSRFSLTMEIPHALSSASFTTPKLAPGEWYRQVHVACWEWNLTLSLNYIYINFPSLFHFSLVLSGPQISGIAGKSLAVRLPYPLSHCSLFLSAQSIAQHQIFCCSFSVQIVHFVFPLALLAPFQCISA